MPERRRRFSPQFKAEAVQMVLETGRSTCGCPKIARSDADLALHGWWCQGMIRRWR
jgi:transposase-like protein